MPPSTATAAFSPRLLASCALLPLLASFSRFRLCRDSVGSLTVFSRGLGVFYLRLCLPATRHLVENTAPTVG
jgi:hypothetical protein